MYIVIMHGATGDYKTEFKSKKKAEKHAENIRLLGYDVTILVSSNGNVAK